MLQAKLAFKPLTSSQVAVHREEQATQAFFNDTRSWDEVAAHCASIKARLVLAWGIGSWTPLTTTKKGGRPSVDALYNSRQ